MDKKNEFKASNVEDAIEQGLAALNITREEAIIKIISKGGFLSKATVRIEKKEEEKDDEFQFAEVQAEPIKETQETEQMEEKPIFERTERPESESKIFLEKLLKMMNLSCTVEERRRDGELDFFIKGEDAHAVIGYRGETLDALQHVVTQMVKKGGEDYERIMVDADFYRQKRENTLTNLAKRLAKKASITQERIELEPMNSFERRIIHYALQDSKMAASHSEGEGKDRHIVIEPLGNGFISEQSYDTTNFKKTGPGKTRSFGYSKKRF